MAGSPKRSCILPRQLKLRGHVRLLLGKAMRNGLFSFLRTFPENNLMAMIEKTRTNISTWFMDKSDPDSLFRGFLRFGGVVYQKRTAPSRDSVSLIRICMLLRVLALL